MGFALAHAEQASLDDLEAVRLQVREQEEQPVFRRREGAVLIDGKLAGGAGFPIEAPRRHVGLERRLKGRNELLKLVEGQAGEIQKFRCTRLHIGKPWSRRTASMLPLDSGFPPSAPRTGQVPLSTSGGPIPAAFRIFAFSFPSR
jgi:hypothetical protein